MGSSSPGTALRVEVLGPIRAWLGDTEIRLGPTRQRAVFAVLAIRCGQVVSRDELVRAVWGDEAPTTADGSVHTYMSGLRRVLEPNRPRGAASTVLPSVSPGYRLELARDSLDAAMFDALSGDARAALGRGDPAAALRIADEALDMWHGEPLAGLPGPFAADQRLRLAGIRFALLEARAEAGLATGRHVELVAELTTLVAQHPLHEGLRGQLMIALYRSGRQADALDHFHEARQALESELGSRPAARLVEIHQQILVNDPALSGVTAKPLVKRTTRPRNRANRFVNRDAETARLRDAVAGLARGRGGLVWLDGEPGIGKSELLTNGLAGLDTAGVQVAWASGDELARRFPLQVVLQCLGVDVKSGDPRRARVAELAGRTSARDLLGAGDNLLAVVDATVELVRRLCADGPLALVIDDMQWVDETSMLVWDKLARQTGHLPLLLVAACRPMPQSPALDAMRDTVSREGGAMLRLDPLSDGHVSQLLQSLLNATPGPGLGQLAARAAGNPLYVEELVDALVREHAVRVASGVADANTAPTMSLVSALEHRLGFLSPGTVDVLRRASLLGTEFRVAELSTVLARAPVEFLAAIEEASNAGVLVEDGGRMAFRHPLIRQALYEGMVPALRGALHRQAAEALDRCGAAADTVACHLVAESSTLDPWAIAWVHEHGERVASRAPDIGRELLRRAVDACEIADPKLDGLTTSLARVRYRLSESPEDEVRTVLATTRDPDLIGEMHWILTTVLYRRGLEAQAISSLRLAVATAGMSELWRARCLALLAARERSIGEPEAAERTSLWAIREAERVGDVFAKGYALENLWLLRSISRDHAEALRFVDEALTAVSAASDEDPKLASLYVSLLDNRLFSLQSLDRLDDADKTLRVADEVMRRHQLPSGQWVSAAVNHYWAGRWDHAMRELSDVATTWNLDVRFRGLRESGPLMLLLHGVASLIATCRGDEEQANVHLAAADDLPMLTAADRENCDFLIVAEALAAERDGRLDVALIALKPVIDEHYSPMMLRHQWLPDVMRIALAADNRTMAARALEVCASEARRETVPARAAAALRRCRGLLNRAPDELLTAAKHYEQVGRPVELAQALEDAAVLLAETGCADEARAAHAKVVTHYDALGAAWLAHRATSRLKATGVTPLTRGAERPKAG
ncbi:BTAD domain-containing putative transcriptional regulator [Kibdelosporangium phytohabitans]|nr:BTAD domain-containing putative transcriptional regulator [Kibdelosporangium phytohabitans]MBE1463473.1 DNA-binding SARP family transcriptional activator [Kibdelosporangium phytohabitans]